MGMIPSDNSPKAAALPEEDLPQRVSRMMAETFLTLDQFSAILACTKDAVWRLRSGKTRKVDLDLLIAIARWARRKGYSLDWLMLGAGPARLPEVASTELEKAKQIGERATVIISICAMAKRLKFDITDLSGQWAAQMMQGEVPEIDGMELLQRVNDFLKEVH